MSEKLCYEKSPPSGELGGLISENGWAAEHIQYKRQSTRVNGSPSAESESAKMPPRDEVLYRMPARTIPARCTRAMRRQMTPVWARVVQHVHGKKQAAKQEIVSQVAYASLEAYHLNLPIRVSRDRAKVSSINIQAQKAMVDGGILYPYVSTPTEYKETRYMPTAELVQCFTPEQLAKIMRRDVGRYAGLWTRRTRAKEPEELPVDLTDEPFASFQKGLERINGVNAAWEITYRPYGHWIEDFLEPRQMWPVHVAKFTRLPDGLGHGRMYTDERGHQRLRKIERRTIRFDERPSNELDFGSLHPSMAYHLKGMECRSDPYALWGEYSTKDDPRRLLAKQVINTLFNCDSPVAAIEACKAKASLKTKTGAWKQGKELERARKLCDAKRATGLSFEAVSKRAMEVHEAIRDYFFSDAGTKVFMPLDSRIALDVMTAFADRNLPILCVHDSFITLKYETDRLRLEMDRAYRGHVGNFGPVID